MSYYFTKSEPTEDPQYLEWFEAVITGVDEALKTDLFFVVKIDNWFGEAMAWLLGKTLGALGFRKEKLTLPPFVPARVVSQHRFWQAGTDPGRRKRLHVWQRSGENLQRYTEIVLKGASAFWYSGRPASNGQASFMAYVSTPKRALAVVRELAA